MFTRNYIYKMLMAYFLTYNCGVDNFSTCDGLMNFKQNKGHIYE